MRTLLAGLSMLAAAICSSGAMAQQTVDPGRVDERLRPELDIPAPGTVDLPQIPEEGVAPKSDLRVTLTQVRFEGADAVANDVLNALAAPYLGHEMPLAEVFRLAEEVTAEYRRRGYVLSRAAVGPQRIENGVLTIEVVEGFVGEVRVEGDPGGYRRYLEAYLAPVGRSRPTNGDELARALLLAQDLRGIEVRAVLTPSADMIGAADLSLLVERRPLEAFVAVDNRGSRWLGPLQIYGGLTFNDLLGAGERITVTGVSAPDQGGELGHLSASYDQPVGGSGLLFSTFVSYTRTRPGDELRTLGLEGESASTGVALQYPLLRSRSTNVFGRLSFTARSSESRNFFLGPLFRDRTRAVGWDLIANHAAAWGGRFSTRVSVTQGLGAFGATERGDPAKSRATASGEFTRVNVEASWLQALYAGLHLQLGVAGQASPDSLLAAEEFGLGGTHFGRAFDPSEVTGDEGYAGKVELLYTHPARGLGVVESFAYYEGGRVTQNDPLPGEARRESLRSVGGGLRVSTEAGISATIEYAKPLDRDVAARRDRDGRVFVTFSAAY